jgi:uncharacterized RDD family membrane protein YckC
MTPSPKARFLISLLDYMINRSWYPPLLLIWFLIKDGMLHILGFFLEVALVFSAGWGCGQLRMCISRNRQYEVCKTFNLGHNAKINISV